MEFYCGPRCQRIDRPNHRKDCHGMCEFRALPGVVDAGLDHTVWGVLGKKWTKRRGPGLGRPTGLELAV
jgi:hypothetical protein